MLNGMTAYAVSNLSYQNKLSLLSAAGSPMPFVELICYISIDWGVRGPHSKDTGIHRLQRFESDDEV
jgi:hypothetical protein